MRPIVLTRGRRLAAKWQSIQRAALAVVVLSQRDEDRNERLWYFPTSLFEELQTLAPQGSVEAALKDQTRVESAYRRFGNASITVTWKALTALMAGTGEAPAASRDVIRGLSEFQSADGAYGSKVPRQHGHTINDCARHTAMALLIHMDFGEDRTPGAIMARFERPVRWLLGPAALGSGGWAFEQSSRSQQEGLGGTSTVACIMALARFVTVCGEGPLQANGLLGLIKDKLSLSLGALASSRTASGLWDLRNEGLPTETRVAESAYIISGIRYAINNGELLSLVNDASNVLLDMQRGLLDVGTPLEQGWPAESGGLSVSLAATVCALHALSDLKPEQLRDKDRKLILSAEERLVRDIVRDNAWEFLRSWDWATLVELASHKVGPVPALDLSRLSGALTKVSAAKANGRVSPATLRGVPTEARAAVRYCLTRGLRVPLRDTPSSKLRSASGEFVRKSGWVVWTVLISAAVGFLLSKLSLK